MNILQFKNSKGFTETENNLIKKALVAIEGDQTDSNNKKHTFSIDRLEKIVENSNKHLSKFKSFLIKDHKVNSDSTLGKIEGLYEGKTIAVEDLPTEYKDNEEIKKDLVGKYGLFCNKIELFNTDFVEKIDKGLKGLSMGLCVDDPDNERIIELSLTPDPAIPHMTLFSGNYTGYYNLNQGAASWNDIVETEENKANFKSAYEKRCSQLFLLISNLQNNENSNVTNTIDATGELINLLNGFANRVISDYSSIFANGGLPVEGNSSYMLQKGAYQDANMRNATRLNEITRATNNTLNRPFSKKYIKQKLIQFKGSRLNGNV